MQEEVANEKEQAKKPEINIIFVDDDKNILHGLKCMLREMRSRWNMAFCSSAQEAIAVLEKNKFDVIISDMRMPGIDGSELLAKVKELYPHMMRIILSGYSDEDMILKTLDSTDQFLSKPCKKEELISVVEQSISNKNVFKGQDVVLELVAGMEQLPTIPTLYMELTKLLKSENSSLKEISDLISVDVSMTAKILQLVNSAFFGLRHRIVDIHQATVYLGIRTIKAVVIMADVFSKFSEEEMKAFPIDAIYSHSVTVSSIARQIAVSVSAKIVDDVGMAAMLHDIGKIVFIRNKSEEYKKFFATSGIASIPLHLMEKPVVGTTHAEVGAYLMGVWGIPQEVVVAISMHHSEEETESSVVNIVRAANALFYVVKEKESSVKSKKCNYYIKYLESLNLGDDLNVWFDKADALINSTAQEEED